MRYIRQRDNFNCGPIAIINTLKWIGYPVSYEGMYPFLAKACKIDNTTGVEDKLFRKVLVEVGSMYDFKVRSLKHKYGILLKTIIPNLIELSDGGCTFIFRIRYYEYPKRTWLGHYTVAGAAINEGLELINFEDTKATVSYASYKYLQSRYLIPRIYVIRPN